MLVVSDILAIAASAAWVWSAYPGLRLIRAVDAGQDSWVRSSPGPAARRVSEDATVPAAPA